MFRTYQAVFWALAIVSACTIQVGAAADLPNVTIERNLPYVAHGHERQKLDLYLPTQEAGAVPLPVLVWIHGGAWQEGSKDNPPALPLLSDGYALASINYRLSQHAVFPAQIEDCKAAIRWLRANAKKYHLDPDHIGVFGASAGGHLAALLGTTAGVKALEGTLGNADQSSQVQCVVDWFGPTDLAALAGADEDVKSPIAKLLGGPAIKHPELAKQGSPLTYVGRHVAPIMITHGTKDSIVPIAQSADFAAALKKAGADVTYTVVEGGGHGFTPQKTAELALPLRAFLAKYLKPPK
ncbi:MAG TPA: alpha/beta hydrolase [Pirellulales bacterium]|jgi:acetyl esterase/lipase|nr:alpha/beta hydrolase [Pirellulales bacterium]